MYKVSINKVIKEINKCKSCGYVDSEYMLDFLRKLKAKSETFCVERHLIPKSKESFEDEQT